jgi:tripartite-type tricarboxylate transporter receptor subunit TctC
MRLLSPIIAALSVFLAGAVPASAEYPEKPILLVVPFAAGGPTDLIARIVAEHMTKTLGQAIIIENVPGAGGTTAARRGAQATADGYVILMGSMGTHGAAPAVYPDLKYDPARDFTPIGLTAGVPQVIVTRKDFPANNLKEFVDYVRRNEDKVNEAHAGVGSASHTICTLLQSTMGTKTGRVAYRGVGPAVNDLVGGQVDFGCLGLTTVVSQIQGGTIKAIAIATPERADVIKDVPTTKEGGLSDFQASSWNGIFAPRNLPLDTQAKLNDAVDRALEDPDTLKRLLDIGSEVPTKADRTPQALQKLVESEVSRWSSLLKAVGVTAK